jgi:AbrB family looped-hinge helix DNA binding protein
MAEATVTSKGQITIPKPVRDALGLATGDRVEFIETDEGYRLSPVTRDVRELKGMFAGRRARPATTAEMDAAVRRAAARRLSQARNRRK